MLSLLYISRCIVPEDQWSAALADVQSASAAENSVFDITGLLIATPDWFAQILEGPPENIDLAMAGILADPRHSGIRILRRLMINRRRFPLWRLARFDHGAFEASHVRPALEQAYEGAGERALGALDRLIDRLLPEGHRNWPGNGTRHA